MNGLRFATKVVHPGFLREDPHGSLHMPVYDNVAFEFRTAEDLELAFQGRKPAHMYSRISNPTVEHFEHQVRSIAGAFGVLALSSGMAAISNTLLAVCRSGDNVITSRHLFGNTYSLFESTLKGWGLETRYADLTDPRRAEALVDGRTRAIYFETVTNPQLEVADAARLSELARARGLLLVADTTVTPFYLFDSAKHGVDIEVLSSTKYISGGATSVGGLIIDYGSYDWTKNPHLAADAARHGPHAFIHKLRREVFRNLGACLSAHNAYLQSLGLETMALRVDASCANAQRIAEFLEARPGVRSVHYPGLKSSKSHETARRQFGARCGALLTFDLGSRADCFRFLNALKVIRRATNLQDNRTLILHPASTIFCEYPRALREEMGVRETMLRLAVGIEDAEDLMADLAQALDGLGRPSST